MGRGRERERDSKLEGKERSRRRRRAEKSERGSGTSKELVLSVNGLDSPGLEVASNCDGGLKASLKRGRERVERAAGGDCDGGNGDDGAGGGGDRSFRDAPIELSSRTCRLQIFSLAAC